GVDGPEQDGEPARADGGPAPRFRAHYTCGLVTVTGSFHFDSVSSMELSPVGSIWARTRLCSPPFSIHAVPGTGEVACSEGISWLTASALTWPVTLTVSVPSICSVLSDLASEKFARMLATPVSGFRIVD